MKMFDASGAVRFDLARGTVQVRQEGAHVLVPKEVLERALFGSDTEGIATRYASDVTASILGRRQQPASDGFAEVVEQLAGELALRGLGALRLQLWGDAAVFVWSGCPLQASGAGPLKMLLEHALHRLGGRPVSLALLEENPERATFGVFNALTAQGVEERIASGQPWQRVLSSMAREETAR